MSSLAIDLAAATRVVLLSVLVTAVVMKLREPQPLRWFIGELGLSKRLCGSAVWLIGIGESVAIVLLVTGPLRLAGAVVLGLFLAFILTLAYAPKRTVQPCGCFGTTTSDIADWKRLMPRLLGAAGASLVATVGERASGWPSVRASWMATLAVSSFLGWLIAERTIHRAPRPESSFPSISDVWAETLPRRAVLQRMIVLGGSGVVASVIGPIARVFACTAIQPPVPIEPCTLGASSLSLAGGSSSVGSRQGASAGGVDRRAACMTGCSQRKVLCDAQASDEFDSCAAFAGNDENRLMACADTYRLQLTQCWADFQTCAVKC